MEEQLQDEAEQGAHQHLLAHQQDAAQVDGVHLRHRRQGRHQDDGDGQRQVQAHPQRHQLGADHRHGHQQRGDTEQRQQETADPATDLRVAELEHGQPISKGMF
ncbi:hypothetical protein D3C72_2029140 [compost metagenome]